VSAFRTLEAFHREVMAYCPPRGEALIPRLRPGAWGQVSFRYILSVPAMVEISRIIEDAAAQSRRTADLHVSFQVLSREVQALEGAGLSSSMETLRIRSRATLDPWPGVWVRIRRRG
jgi:hypothetical protein